MSYSMNSDVCHDFEMTLVDKSITVPITTCLLARPMIETIEELDEIGAMSKLGNGWDVTSYKTWFCKKDERDLSTARKIMTNSEAEESIIIDVCYVFLS